MTLNRPHLGCDLEPYRRHVGLHRLLPLIPRFTAAHSDVRLDLVLTDRVVDLMDDRADVAIRIGPMRPPQLMARKLGESRMAVVAAPAYCAIS